MTALGALRQSICKTMGVITAEVRTALLPCRLLVCEECRDSSVHPCSGLVMFKLCALLTLP